MFLFIKQRVMGFLDTWKTSMKRQGVEMLFFTMRCLIRCLGLVE